MLSIQMLLLILAALCFLAAALGLVANPDGRVRVNLTALGLFFWVVTQLLR
jgi:hypothetical protein